MAISSTYSGTMITRNDLYDGQRYYSEQERRYREEMERQRMMQQMAYNPYTQSQQGMTDLQREKQAEKPKAPAYLDNKKLLLLGEAS